MIAEVLLQGSENAQTGRSICALLGITERELALRIERERRAGAPICASCGSTPGYYLATSRDEMQAYCRRLRSRAKEVNKTARCCELTADKLD